MVKDLTRIDKKSFMQLVVEMRGYGVGDERRHQVEGCLADDVDASKYDNAFVQYAFEQH